MPAAEAKLARLIKSDLLDGKVSSERRMGQVCGAQIMVSMQRRYWDWIWKPPSAKTNRVLYELPDSEQLSDRLFCRIHEQGAYLFG